MKLKRDRTDRHKLAAEAGGWSVLFLLIAGALLFGALGEALPGHCSAECEDDCHESCDCINCLQHQLQAIDLAPEFESTYGSEAPMMRSERALSPQVSARGIDRPPQNFS